MVVKRNQNTTKENIENIRKRHVKEREEDVVIESYTEDKKFINYKLSFNKFTCKE